MVYQAETGKGAWVKSNRQDLPKAKSFTVGTDDGEGVLPETVALWFGLPDDNPCLRTGVGLLHGKLTSTEAATDLNDSFKWTFAEIAEAIKRTFLTKEKK